VSCSDPGPSFVLMGTNRQQEEPKLWRVCRPEFEFHPHGKWLCLNSSLKVCVFLCSHARVEA